MSGNRRFWIAVAVLLGLLLGPCSQAAMDSLRCTPTATVEAAPEQALAGRPVAGWAHGAVWRCGGKFNWRGQYIGPYCHEVPVSTQGAYWKNGRYYMPALTMRTHQFGGWWIRFGYGSSSWKDSVVRWTR